jgi:hypothetical protein
MTQHFIRYTSLANYQLSHIRESQPLLQKYVATLTDEPVSREDVIQFLNALDNGIDDETTLMENRWTVLLKSTLQGYSIEKIKSITTEFKERCAKPAIYLDQLPPYNYDVIRKRRLASGFMTRKCIR